MCVCQNVVGKQVSACHLYIVQPSTGRWRVARGGAHSLQQEEEEEGRRPPTTGARPWRLDLGAPDLGEDGPPHPHKPHLILLLL